MKHIIQQSMETECPSLRNRINDNMFFWQLENSDIKFMSLWTICTSLVLLNLQIIFRLKYKIDLESKS